MLRHKMGWAVAFAVLLVLKCLGEVNVRGEPAVPIGEQLASSLMSKEEISFAQQNPEPFNRDNLPAERIASLKEQLRRLATIVVKPDEARDVSITSVVVASYGRFRDGEVIPGVISETVGEPGSISMFQWIRCRSDKDPMIQVQVTGIRTPNGSREPTEVLLRMRSFQQGKDGVWHDLIAIPK